ncbi:MAG: threonine ammonia-lyase [Actinomycetes bacterium]
MSLVTVEEIRRAADRVRGVALRTPVVSYTGPRVDGLLLKAESLQPTGAFKVRGASNALACLDAEQRARGVVTHSSGNHAQALAYAAHRLGVRAVTVMPHDVSPVKREATERWGAEIVLVEPAEREAATDELVEKHGYVPVPPYDHRDVIAGQGTVGLEIVEDVPDVDLVLVPVSGGGLVSGIAAAVKALRPSARVVGVEPELAADAQASVWAGELVGWSVAETNRTVADGLRVPRLGDLTWAHIKAYVEDVVTVSEDDIRQAVRDLATGARLVAEPSGATAPAAAFAKLAGSGAPGRTVAVVSGGVVDPGAYAGMLA